MAHGLSIGLIPSLRRRLNGVRTVASGAVDRTIPQDEFVATCARYRQEARDARASMPGVVDALWRCEGFATTFGKFRLPENTLNDSRIPREILPIAHVGYGAASTEHARFDPSRLIDIIESRCDPNYRGFAYEGIGSVLRIYEPGIFKLMCGTTGLIPLPAPSGPDRTGFFATFLNDFTPDMQRQIAHGYGRLVTFSNLGIDAAIREALTLPEPRREPCLTGVAFAFAMMNAEETPRLFAHSLIDYPGPIRAAFQNGLAYSLICCEWLAPGLLVGWKPSNAVEERIVSKASDESARNVRRGYPLSFLLEDPFA